jgi:hypothetical protein
VRAFIAVQPGHALFASEVTFTEIRYGIERLSDPARRTDLVNWLDRILRPLFAGRVLPVSEDVLLRWRQMLEAGRKKGHTFGQPDLLIAAQAALAELIVVSRDTAELIAANVPVFDPRSWTLHARGDASPIPIADGPGALAIATALIAKRSD